VSAADTIDQEAIEAALVAWARSVAGSGVAVWMAEQSEPRPMGAYVELRITSTAQDGADQAPVDMLPILALSQQGKWFQVAGDHARKMAAGKSVVVSESSGNDATYTIAASRYLDGQTRVTVAEALASATVDGYLTGTREVTSMAEMTIRVECHRQRAVALAQRLRDSLDAEDEASDAILTAAGLAVYPSGVVQNLTGLGDTSMVSRAGFDAVLLVPSVRYEYPGIVDHLIASGTVLRDDGTTAGTISMEVDA